MSLTTSCKSGALAQDTPKTNFRFDGFGKHVLSRKGLDHFVTKSAEEQLAEATGSSTGVYLSGCRGMGNTCDLKFVAQDFVSTGW